MKTWLTPSAACRAEAALSLDALSDEQLRRRQRKAREMVAVVAGLMLLVVVMAGVSGLYPIALTATAMIATLDDYLKKTRAAGQELARRGLV